MKKSLETDGYGDFTAMVVEQNRLNESTTHEYAYDADGNMTSERNKLTGETKTYNWDSENRLIAFEHRASDIAPIDIAAAYKYDIFGRRLQKNVNNVITNFFWEGDTLAYELNDQYQPTRKYLTSGLGIPSGDSITSCFAKPQQSDAMDDYEGHLEYSEPATGRASLTINIVRAGTPT